MKARRILLAILAVIVAALLAGYYWLLLRPMPKTSGTIHLPTLKADVEVERDAQGIPHLRAQSLDDLYQAQGYVVAQDRLWQLELLRRVARGELSEFAGPAALPLDLDTRLLGLRDIAERAVATLPAEQRQAINAYGQGVNAFIADSRGNLPLEFRLLGIEPRPWTTVDSLAIGLHMFRNLTTSWKDELMKQALVERAGAERVAELLPVRSERDHPPGPIADFKLKIADYGTSSIPFGNLQSAIYNLQPEALPGSNNWVVSPAHSASGKAMLANDPHLEYSLPGIWYVMHLEAPGVNVEGVTLPGLPAVVIGHNQHIAWGMTNVGADVQDLYRETFDPQDSSRYLAGGRWEKVFVRKEVIRVRRQADRTLDVVITRHGPVIVNQAGERYTLRWTAAEPGTYRFPFLEINRAQSWEEFTAALSRFPGPAQNFVYADDRGNIGYYAAGMVPIRAKGDGSLSHDGKDLADDWKGFIPFEQLPHVYNPPSGIIATANARISPDKYPYVMATAWENPERTDRIYQLLDPAKKFTPDDFRRIQVDIYSGHHLRVAKAVAEAVSKVGADNPRVRQAAEALGKWDGYARKEQYEPTLAFYTRGELMKRILEPVLGDRATQYRWRLSTVFLDQVLKERPARWLPPGVADYDHLLTASLAAALGTIETRFGGADMTQWRWGHQMELTFTNPVGGSVPLLKRIYNIGPFELSGTAWSVKQTTPTLGPSMRFVVDWADIDSTTLTLPEGESGHPLSPHYRDQFPHWMDGTGVPLASPAREKLVLQP